MLAPFSLSAKWKRSDLTCQTQPCVRKNVAFSRKHEASVLDRGLLRENYFIYLFSHFKSKRSFIACTLVGAGGRGVSFWKRRRIWRDEWRPRWKLLTPEASWGSLMSHLIDKKRYFQQLDLFSRKDNGTIHSLHVLLVDEWNLRQQEVCWC